MLVKIKGISDSGVVFINDHLLNPQKSQAIRNHSPDGFSWGYAGSGPAQLALAILLELYSEEYAMQHYQEFKNNVIAKLPQEDFEIEIEI